MQAPAKTPGRPSARTILNRSRRPVSANPNLYNPQRNLNNAFAYDLVPSPSVVSAALRAARRVNDFPTAVRIFEGTSDAGNTTSLQPLLNHPVFPPTETTTTTNPQPFC